MRTGVFAAALLAVWVTRPIATGAGSSSDGTAFVNGRKTASAVSAKVEQAMGAQETFKNMELALPTDPKERFHALGHIAKAAYDGGYYDKARGFSHELLSLAPYYRDDWYYGQAV